MAALLGMGAALGAAAAAGPAYHVGYEEGEFDAWVYAVSAGHAAGYADGRKDSVLVVGCICQPEVRDALESP